jgi:hypothetical protein
MKGTKVRDRLGRIADEWERLVNSDSLKWLPVAKDSLASSTIAYLEDILEPSGIQYLMADQRVEGTVLFKLTDPQAVATGLCYLHHDPQTHLHQWGDAGFHNGLNGNDVLLYLCQRRHGLVPREARTVYEAIDRAAGVDPTEGKRLILDNN